MFARITFNTVLCAAAFLVPMAAHSDRLLHPAPWLGFAVALIVLLSQPATDLRESASRASADRGSALGIFGSMFAAQLFSALDFSRGSHAGAGVAFVIGACVAVFGLALRLWAIRTLGRFFTSTVRVVGDQAVVRSGPYRVLRHPSYTGALLAAFGTAVAFASPLGAALVLALCIPAYLYRIRTEEFALMSQLGEPYRVYRRESWGLVPGIR